MDAIALVFAFASMALSIFTLAIVFSIAKNVNRLQQQIDLFVTTEPATPQGFQVTYRVRGGKPTVEYIDEPTEADVVRALLQRGVNPATVTITKNGP